MRKALVTVGGGFIGNHFVTWLVRHGYWVLSVDIKRPEYLDIVGQEFELIDLGRPEAGRFPFTIPQSAS